MAGSGDAVRAMAGSGDAVRTMAGSVVGEGTLLRSLDYPCTERLRLRRLLAYLRRHGHIEIYDVAKEKMRVIFHMRDLVKQVKAGQLREACYYVRSFAPFVQSSDEATVLALFLQDLRAILDFADGHTMAAGILCDWFISLYNHPVLTKYPCFANLVADVLFLRSDRVRASLDWKLVINKAAELVEAIAYKTPELKDRMHYPRGPNNLDNVVPVGSSLVSFRQRRQAKKSGQKQSTDIAQFYLQLKKRLPPSIPGQNCRFSGPASNKWEVLIALLDKALQAGRDPVLKQGHPTGSLSKEVFPLKALVTRGSMVCSPQNNQGLGSEHSSKLDTSQIPATVSTPEINSGKLFAMASPKMNSAMKHSSYLESHKDAPDPGNVSKRPRVTGTGSFGELRQG